MAPICGVRSGIPLGRTLNGLVRLWETPADRLVGTTNYDAVAATRDLGFSLPVSTPPTASTAAIDGWKQRVMETARPVASSRLVALAEESNIVGAVRKAEIDIGALPTMVHAGFVTIDAASVLLMNLRSEVDAALAIAPRPWSECKRAMVGSALSFLPLFLLGPAVHPELVSVTSMIVSAMGFLGGIISFGLMGGWMESTRLARYIKNNRTAESKAFYLLNAMADKPCLPKWGRFGFLLAYWRSFCKWDRLSTQIRNTQSCLHTLQRAA